MSNHLPTDPKKITFMTKVVRAAMQKRKARYLVLGRPVAAAYASPSKEEIAQVGRDMARHGIGSQASTDVAVAWIAERERPYDAQLEKLEMARHAARIVARHERA